ncbi:MULTISPECIES: helix-turn-helix transcriptional regulator [unclassified Mesorhizobium]|uniref:helix-turn-helix transcriptional regulator n=1 Tax=unclassified Mesorhizobium TaxID=325217 RepID=UPI001CCA8E75|nr:MULTISPECIES: LuxR C-terminal-related transcriptional regulator [unclassified Mesorhizobium]MBZ9815213.1 LuxR C-terminal-related transcriptional regulator [Mesorhizobium sp. CA7]MBZ9862053.1 LuxR C-terminal-related transcriptional regulator [Mesorhizobium sp. CA12]
MNPARMHDFDGMVGQIYDAAVEPGRWPQVLETLSDFLEGAATKLTFQNARTLRSEASSVRMPPEADLTYAQYYHKTNVFLPRIAKLRAGALIPVWDLVPREVYQRSEFYNDFCRPGDMCHPIGVVLANEPDMRVVFTCGRARTAGEFEPEHLERLRRVGPHLVRAASVGLRLSRSEIARSANVEALDRIAQGVLIVAASGEILFANRTAEALLSEADGIKTEKSALRATRRSDAAQFQRLIVAAAERSDTAGGVMALARPAPRRPLSVLVAPLKIESTWFVTGRPAAIVFVADPDSAPRTMQAQVRNLYRLTPAEAAVAIAVARGEGLQAAADELGISLTTVRTHLQHVFEKTETRRQAELVRLIAASGVYE